jgi:hypothetical protein
MNRLAQIVPLLALLAFGCKQSTPAHRMGTSVNIAPTGVFQIIPAGVDPNDINLPGAVGTRVQNAGGANAWDKGSDGLWHSVTGASGGGGQDASAVQITGGTIVNTSINGIDAGNMALSENYLEDFEGWKREMFREVHAIDPSMTYCWAKAVGAEAIVTGDSATLTVATEDANVEGGGVTSGGGIYTHTKYSISQNAAGGHIAYFFYDKMALPTSGVIALAGLINQGASLGVSFAARNSISSTNFVGTIVGGATVTLSTADTAWHTQLYVDDATTLRFYIDGVLGGSTTTRTNIPGSGPSYLYWYNDTKGNVKVRWLGYCTAQPPA